MSCEKTLIEEDLYPVCRIEIDSIYSSPINGFNIQVQYWHTPFVVREDSTIYGNPDWVGIYHQPEIVWKDYKTSFSFELDQSKMALRVKPGTCPGTIHSFRVKVYVDEVFQYAVRKSGLSSKFERIELN
jgi:hypothetical protein